MKVIAGYSRLGEINQVLVRKGQVSIVCAACSAPLIESTKKIIVDELVYCEKDALVAAQAISPKLKDGKELTGRLLTCRIKGLKELYLYAPTPGSN